MHDNVRDNLEKIIISSCIHNEDFFVELIGRDIELKDFKTNICQLIFDIMNKYFESEASVPSHTVIEQEVLSYLHTKIKDKSQVEQLHNLYKDIVESKNEPNEEALKVHFENFLSFKMKDGILDILNNARAIAEDKDAEEVLDYILDSYVTSFDSKDEVEGINFYDLMRKDIDVYNPYAEKVAVNGEAAKTGIYLLDTKYFNGGVLEGNMCIIGGRPGSGKTTLGKVIAKNTATNGQPTLFISLEMSKEQIAQGYYAQTARVELGKILRRELTPEEYNKVLIAIDKEENKLKNYHIVDSDSLTVSQLINMLIRYKKKENIKVLILDYIQQIRLPNGNIPKNEMEYSMVSELIRTIVKKLKLSAFIMAQLNRDVEKRQDRHPVASDLRSSGKLEQDAAYILTTYRDEIYNRDTEIPKTMDISIAKNRFGPMGMVRVKFEGEYQEIGNLIDGDVEN